MNLDEYSEIAGVDVADAQRKFVSANIDTARYMLESALGFPLDADKAKQNLYTETGKAPSDSWICGGSDADLLPADDEPNEVYRLFPQEALTRPHTAMVRIDPCTAISKVKLVHGTVSVHAFSTGEFALLAGTNGYGHLVDLEAVFPNPCRCGHRLQVAVSADWLGREHLPDDLFAVWADLVTHLSDKSRNIRSENRGTRSYTKFEAKSPLDDSWNQGVLAAYAGPRGTAGRLPI